MVAGAHPVVVGSGVVGLVVGVRGGVVELAGLGVLAGGLGVEGGGGLTVESLLVANIKYSVSVKRPKRIPRIPRRAHCLDRAR